MLLTFGFLDWSLVAIGALQALSVIVFFIVAMSSNRITVTSSNRLLKPLQRIRKGWSLSTQAQVNILLEIGAEGIDEKAFHTDAVSTFLRQRSDALIVGALGLAAWSV